MKRKLVRVAWLGYSQSLFVFILVVCLSVFCSNVFKVHLSFITTKSFVFCTFITTRHSSLFFFFCKPLDFTSTISNVSCHAEEHAHTIPLLSSTQNV